MLGEIIKHQSLSQICNRFVNKIRLKYNNKITVGEYMVERFINQKINIGYSSKQNYDTPFFTMVNKYKNFYIVFNSFDATSGQCAVSYAKHTENTGLIFSTYERGFSNICRTLDNAVSSATPLMLILFYDQQIEYDISSYLLPERRFIKTHHTIQTPEKFPNMMEYMLTMAELPKKGPVQLNICNKILKKQVNLDDINVDGSPVDGSPVDGSPVDGSPVDGSPVDGSPVDGSPHNIIYYPRLHHIPFTKPYCVKQLQPVPPKTYSIQHSSDDKEQNLLQYFEQHYEQIDLIRGTENIEQKSK